MYSKKFSNKELRNMFKWAIKKWEEKYGEELTYPRVTQNLKIVWNELELEALEQQTLEEEINNIINS